MPDAAKSSCETCGAKVAELRRGRCWGCYLRWTEARPVGFGASCAVCFEKRRDNLRSVELMGRWLPMCHNCASKSARLEPMPPTLDGIRQRLERDRRGRERRWGKPDTRVFKRDRRGEDRREAERRAGLAGAPQPQPLDVEDLLEGFGQLENDPDHTLIREVPGVRPRAPEASPDAIGLQASVILDEVWLDPEDYIEIEIIPGQELDDSAA